MPITPAEITEVEESTMIPPPVMGWNTRDPKSAMDPLYAADLENFFPEGGVVKLRNGYTIHSTGLGVGNVSGLGALEYGSVSALVAATTDNRIYDVSADPAVAIDGGGPIGGSIIGPAMLQFRDRLFIKPYPTTASTTDDVYAYTGSGNIAAAGFTGPGGDDEDLYAMGAYRNRLYFAQHSAPSIWYGGVNSVSGALTEFPLTSVLRFGFGLILFCGSLARAKEYAEDELFCIVTSSGEVLVYSGENPESTTWNLVGRYRIPEPAGLADAFFYSGSDLFVVTRLGIVSIKKAMSGQYEGAYPVVNDNIQSAFKEVFFTSGYAYLNFASGIAYPKGGYVLANVTNTDFIGPDAMQQFVMNTTTGAWCKFTNQPARCWAVWKDDLYFGSEDLNSAHIFKADNGYFDEDPDNPGEATARTIKIRHAFNYMGDPKMRKQFVAAIPTTYQSEGLSITANIDVDYEDTEATSEETDTSKGTDYQIYQPRLALSASSGRAGSFRIDGTVTTKRFTLEATQIFWTKGTSY